MADKKRTVTIEIIVNAIKANTDLANFEKATLNKLSKISKGLDDLKQKTAGGLNLIDPKSQKDALTRILDDIKNFKSQMKTHASDIKHWQTEMGTKYVGKTIETKGIGLIGKGFTGQMGVQKAEIDEIERAIRSYISRLNSSLKEEEAIAKRNAMEFVQAQKAKQEAAKQTIRQNQQNANLLKNQTENEIKEERKAAQERGKAEQLTQQAKRQAAILTIRQNQQNANLLKKITDDEIKEGKRAAKEREKAEKEKTAAMKRAAKERQGVIKQEARDSEQFWKSVLSGITSILGAVGIINSVMGAITALVDVFKEATEAALEFAQVQYNLGVQVEAAQRELGAGAGTLSEWQNRIRKLRSELSIYSTKDVTQAVTQTSVLTRVLKLNADQQEQVIKIAAALAQTSGVDLSRAIDDVTKALGGSSVVLDKYGLFIRDADKGAAAFQLGFTDKVLKSTQTLNSQQLALATLKTIMDQVNPLYKSLGDYQSSLPGMIKEVNAALEDQSVALGTSMGQWKLFFDNLKLGFMTLLADIVTGLTGVELPNGHTLMDYIEEANKGWKERREDAQRNVLSQGYIKQTMAGTEELDISKFGLETKAGEFRPKGQIGTVQAYTPEQLTGSKEALERYTNFYKRMRWEQYLADQKYLEGKQKTDAEIALLEQKAEERSRVSVARETPDTGMSEEEEKLMDQYGQRIVDMYKELEKQKIKLGEDRRKNREKSFKDELDDIDKENEKYKRKVEELDRDLARARTDLDIKHARDIEQLAEDESGKRLDIEEEYQEKQIDATDDFYKKLRELDDEYYFDLRDAVAENDAVAIKKLERRYNLDKKKLEDNLTDKLQEEDNSYVKKLQQLEEETQNRKLELDKRYEQELEDMQLADDRKREDLLAAHDRELDDIGDHYDEVRREIEDQYQLQMDLLDALQTEKEIQLAESLAREEELHIGFITRLYSKYQKFLGTDLPALWDVYTTQQAMDAGNIPEITDPMSQEIAALEAFYGSNLPEPTNARQEVGVVITLDEPMLDARVTNTVSDTIQTVINRTGGRSYVR